jgi:hypothetical protein
MKKFTILFSSIFFCLLVHNLKAQGGGANLNNNNTVGWNNIPTNLTNENVDYSDVNGTCFWNQNWLRAKVVMKNGAIINVPKAKLNLYSNELHYLNEAGAERSVRNGVDTVIFYSSAGASKLGIFKSFSGVFLNDKDALINDKEVYAQILVSGKTQFLKVTSIKLIQRDTDPFLKKPEWRFEPKEKYFLERKGNTHELKGLNKNYLFALIEKEDNDDNWLKTQKNKLRNENDIIAFLFYRNSLAQ